jgi:hypothetical protein
MGWKPLHPDERIAHERERQSVRGRLSRYGRYLRHHPWHALRRLAIPLLVVALAATLVLVAL